MTRFPFLLLLLSLILVAVIAVDDAAAHRLDPFRNVFAEKKRQILQAQASSGLRGGGRRNNGNITSSRGGIGIDDDDARRRPEHSIPFISDNNIHVSNSDPTTCPMTVTTKKLDIPTRKMWGWGPGLSGYCGETSFQAMLILNGAWVSAERVRYADGNAELLIGVNDDKAAQNLNINYKVWDGYKENGQDFLDTFVKPNIDAGATVVAGFYEYMNNGDRDYDHIMVIKGYDFDPNAGTNGHVVGFYFNDLWDSAERHSCKYKDASGTSNPKFVASRSACTGSAGSQPYSYCIPATTQYAIALKSLSIQSKLPAGLTTQLVVGGPDTQWEPDWGAEDGLHQAPVAQSLSLKIRGLVAGQPYTVLRFDSANALVDGKNPPFDASYSWKYDIPSATGTTMTIDSTVLGARMSDGEFYYVTIPKQ